MINNGRYVIKLISKIIRQSHFHIAESARGCGATHVTVDKQYPPLLDGKGKGKVHADKWIEPERLEELEEIRQKKIKEEQEKPVQLSLFDMM